MYDMALIARLYGEKDFACFKDDWVSLAYIVVTTTSLFSWAIIFPHQLNNMKHRMERLSLGWFLHSIWHPICWIYFGGSNIFRAINLNLGLRTPCACVLPIFWGKQVQETLFNYL
jgi:hypothetical protein